MKIHCQKLAMFIQQFEENKKSVFKFATFTGVLIQKFLQNDKKERISSWEFQVCEKKKISWFFYQLKMTRIRDNKKNMDYDILWIKNSLESSLITLSYHISGWNRRNIYQPYFYLLNYH